jgi:hypothetical protein
MGQQFYSEMLPKPEMPGTSKYSDRLGRVFKPRE